MDYSGIITVEPDKRGGKPCIRGLRIMVHDVLDPAYQLLRSSPKRRAAAGTRRRRSA